MRDECGKCGADKLDCRCEVREKRLPLMEWTEQAESVEMTPEATLKDISAADTAARAGVAYQKRRAEQLRVERRQRYKGDVMAIAIDIFDSLLLERDLGECRNRSELMASGGDAWLCLTTEEKWSVLNAVFARRGVRGYKRALAAATALGHAMGARTGDVETEGECGERVRRAIEDSAKVWRSAARRMGAGNVE